MKKINQKVLITIKRWNYWKSKKLRVHWKSAIHGIFFHFWLTNFSIKKYSAMKNQIQYYPPIKFINAIENFEDGQVYKVLLKNNEGRHVSLKYLKNTPLE